MINIVEILADEESEGTSCKWGNLFVGHACYCHHPDNSRKCRQYRNNKPYEECELYELVDFDAQVEL